jgi:2-haloacid dehalogenase
LTHPPSVTAAVFDLGGVLIDWDPRHLYRRLFDGDDVAMEAFLTDVCNASWNALQDAGRPWSEAVTELAARHPEQRALIEAYRARWPEMLGGPIQPTVDILGELRQAGVPLFALSNWSAETYPIARKRFEFLGWFDSVVISGDMGITKPDPRIYHHLLEANRLKAESTLFIDDHVANVEAAAALGFVALPFSDAGALRNDLARFGLLPAAQFSRTHRRWAGEAPRCHRR